MMIGACSGDPVGIDDLSVYVPRLFISTTDEFAASRGIDPGKLTKGIGIERMAILDLHEDAATMASMSTLDLMRKNKLHPEEIGRIYVGTESGVDEAKAIGTYIIGMLEMVYGKGSFQGCSTVEFKSACIGTTHALENMAYWAAAEEDDRFGIVIASDIARYPLRSPGEYTQGAGAVSLLVKRRPRLVALERSFGIFTRDENDFFRPPGCKTAIVNGKHSNSCYLNAMTGAFAAYAKKTLKCGAMKLGKDECVTDHVSHLLFHIPYPRMVEYASAAILRLDWRNLSRWGDVEAEIGMEPVPSDFLNEEEYIAADEKFAKKFSKTELFLQAFRSKVEDSVLISRQVGNIYTGSIYLGLASLIDRQGISSGERICFGSYGSGCSAMVFSGIVQPKATSISSEDIRCRLEKRVAISLEQYEMLHEGRAERSILSPSDEFALAAIDVQGYRHYRHVH
jgi:hydroxymethylglutaryl-CoA synthase